MMKFVKQSYYDRVNKIIDGLVVRNIQPIIKLSKIGFYMKYYCMNKNEIKLKNIIMDLDLQ